LENRAVRSHLIRYAPIVKDRSGKGAKAKNGTRRSSNAGHWILGHGRWQREAGELWPSGFSDMTLKN